MALFLSGMGATIGLILMLGAGYLLGKKNAPKTITRLSEDEEQRLKQIEKARQFNNLMSYDEHKAYGKKVN
jgi:hypothetical protein